MFLKIKEASADCQREQDVMGRERPQGDTTASGLRLAMVQEPANIL